VRAETIVRRLVEDVRSIVHAARIRAVIEVIVGITRARQVSVTSVGRALSRRGLSARHGIKKVDRLLGNGKLQREVNWLYRSMTKFLIRGLRRVVVLIDWTQLHGDLWALTASVPFQGRSIPILSRVHHEKELGSRNAHEAFLSALKDIIGPTTRAVVVADGGFRSPFFNACIAHGIDFVIRLRNDRAVAETDDSRSNPDFERVSFA
jgi:hypothetical protein